MGVPDFCKLYSVWSSDGKKSFLPHLTCELDFASGLT